MICPAAVVAFLLSGCACEYRGPAIHPGQFPSVSSLELTAEVEAAARVALSKIDSAPKFRKIESASSYDRNGQDCWILQIETKGGSIWKASLNRSGESEFEVVSVQEVFKRVGVFRPYARADIIE